MEEYLKTNYDYWQKGYVADNVESSVFRAWGQILRYELADPGKRQLKMIDFGCGQGANLSYFNKLGFDVYGVDISVPDIDACTRRMPEIADHFAIIDPKPKRDDCWFDGGYDLVTAIQALYYYTDTDMQTRLESVYNQMKPGGIFYATMMGTKCLFFDNSVPAEGGLRCVNFKISRMTVTDHYINFIDNKDELLEKFHMFEKIHIGYYDMALREDEGSYFHWTYVGRKK